MLRWRTWSLVSLLQVLSPQLAAGKQRAACPTEGSTLKSSAGGDGQVKTGFRNDAEGAVSLRWVSSSGDEINIDEVDSGESTSMDSYVGHVWRARDLDSGMLIFEGVVPQGVTEHDFVIESCEDLPAAIDADDQEWLQLHGQRDQLAKQGCPLDALVTKEAAGTMNGFHVLCAATGADGKVERLCIFQNGVDTPTCSHSVEFHGGERVHDIINKVIARVAQKWKPMPKAPNPAVFTASGRLLPPEKTLEEVGVPQSRKGLVLILGGVWHWPPIREGFERPIHASVRAQADQHLVLKTLSLRPRIFGVTSFIADAECDRTLEVAGPKVKKSAVSVKDADHGKDVDTWRTSANYFMNSAGDAVLESLDERVQNMTRIPITHSEHIQVLKYDYNGRYVAHTDYFEARDYQKDPATMRMIANGAWNRLLTVFMYMSDVPEGGHTYFPRHGGLKGYVPFDDCDLGYSVRPERRKVILFYNMHPDGKPDPDSLHGGCKVKNGTKWSGNFWMWNVPQGYKSSKAHTKMVKYLSNWDESADQAEEKVLTDFLKPKPKDEL